MSPQPHIFNIFLAYKKQKLLLLSNKPKSAQNRLFWWYWLKSKPEKNAVSVLAVSKYDFVDKQKQLPLVISKPKTIHKWPKTVLRFLLSNILHLPQCYPATLNAERVWLTMPMFRAGVIAEFRLASQQALPVSGPSTNHTAVWCHSPLC